VKVWKLTTVKKLHNAAIGKCGICGEIGTLSALDSELTGDQFICPGCVLCVVFADALLNRTQGFCRPNG
jgi:MinD superfamily P-loop ATPase